MSDKIQHVGRRERLGIVGEDPRFGPRKLSDAVLPPARPQAAVADTMLEQLKGLRQHHGVARLVTACEELRDWPAAAAVWQDRQPLIPAKLESLAKAAAPFLDTIRECEARVNWEGLGWKGKKPSELLDGRIAAWQSPPTHGRG